MLGSNPASVTNGHISLIDNDMMSLRSFPKACRTHAYKENFKTQERFRKNRDIIHSTEEKLLEQFPKCKELLSEYADALRIEAQLESEADFARGFRLGVLIMLDVMTTE